MTISSQTRTAGPFVGTGAIVAYPFGFKVFSTADVLVKVTDATGALTTWALGGNYTVVINSDQNTSPGGTLTPLAALPVGSSLTISSAVALTQSASLTNAGGFFPKTIEDALDRLTILLQQQSTSQTLRVPELTPINALPSVASRANALAAFDANGQPSVVPFGLGNFTGTVSSQALREKQTATAGQATFTLTTIAVATGAVQVFVDGFELPATDITVNSPTSVTLATPLKAKQEAEFVTNTFATFGSGKATLAHVSTSTTDVGSFQVQRTASMPGGTAGFVSSAVRADSYVSAGVTSFEWAGTFVVHNYATAGENVGLYGQGLKYSTGPTWGGTMEAIDWTGQADPTTGLVGLEVDCRANGTDANHSRVALDVVITRPYVSGAPAGAAMQAWCGYRVQTGGDANASVVAAFSTIANGVVGFDCSGATLTQGALKMASGQPILFTAAADRKLYYDGTGFRFSDALNTTIVRFADNGGIQGAGGIQVVGARQGGYSPMTGTANRATVYDTSTITLPQLAGRFMALQADLTLHGLIGA